VAPGNRDPFDVRPTRTLPALVWTLAACSSAQGPADLGGGATIPAVEPAPRPNAGPSRPVPSLALGERHSCAIDQKRLFCWGANDAGQLGLGFASHVPSPPTLVAGVTAPRQVVAGQSHTCALTEEGSLWCWGSNRSGQVSLDDRKEIDRPERVAALVGVIAIAAGTHHTCAIRRSRDVVCWGARPSAPRRERGPRVPIDGVSGAVSLSAGDNHTCALDDADRVWCWGSDSRSQRAELVPDLPSTSAVAVGDGVSCALGKDGGVRCWGLIRPLHPQLSGEHKLPQLIPDLHGVVELALRGASACVRRFDDSVWCWGRERYARVSREFANELRTPLVVAALPRAAGVSVALGDHACVVTGTREIHCWGRADSGQLGVIEPLAREALEVEGIAGVQSIASGPNRSCAVLNDGSVHCWGGSLGKPRAVGELRDAVEVALGGEHGCARNRDGTAACWGNSLGLGNRQHRDVEFPAAQPVDALKDIVEVAAAFHHNCARDEKGSVWCWGGASAPPHGALEPTAPRRVAGVYGARAVAVSQTRGCAVVRSGRTLCWSFGAADRPLVATLDRGLRKASSATDLAMDHGRVCLLSRTPNGDTTCHKGDEATQLAWAKGATDLVLGLGHACALIDGVVRCDGENHNGQLVGDGLADARALAGSGDTTCALMANATVRCWGGRDPAGRGVGAFSPQPLRVVLPR
jgi:alpha-tubulin suppressor-like RCC1 family protein